jgi:hypothetical protein
MTRFLVSAFLVSSLALGCSSRQKFMDDCPGAARVGPSSVPVVLDLKTVAGNEAFALGATAHAQSGVAYKVSKFRYYLSEVTLYDASSRPVTVPLAGADGQPLRYGVALVDYENPESLKLNVLAPPGEYKALNLVFGVPNACPGGEPLNHGDPSARAAPLDVDSDMYWSWNPNYIFLKIEGQALGQGAPKAFFYHVGEDSRRVTVHLHAPFRVATGQPARAELIIDVNRLFVTQAGDDSPRLESGDGVHGGAVADQLAANMAQSGFIKPVHPGAPHAAR